MILTKQGERPFSMHVVEHVVVPSKSITSPPPLLVHGQSIIHEA